MKKIIFKKNNRKGFTIIETMISISLFLVVVMAGLGALLNANLLHQKSQNTRSIMDNMSFIMEEMSRNIRNIKTGTSYYCITGGDSLGNVATRKSSLPGQNCWGIAFEIPDGDTTYPNDQWVYLIAPDTTTPNNPIGIWKSTQGPYTSLTNFIKLTPDEVLIDPVSGFYILGAESPTAIPADTQQPFVIIRLVGSIKSTTGAPTPFHLETSVSQFQIDK